MYYRVAHCNVALYFFTIMEPPLLLHAIFLSVFDSWVTIFWSLYISFHQAFLNMKISALHLNCADKAAMHVRVG